MLQGRPVVHQAVARRRRSARELVDASTTESHLDPLTAAPDRNRLPADRRAVAEVVVRARSRVAPSVRRRRRAGPPPDRWNSTQLPVLPCDAVGRALVARGTAPSGGAGRPAGARRARGPARRRGRLRLGGRRASAQQPERRGLVGADDAAGEDQLAGLGQPDERRRAAPGRPARRGARRGTRA